MVGAVTGLLGFGEWQARLVPVMATLANTVLVGMLGARLFGRRVGLWSGLLFVTFGLVAVTGKMLLTDALLLVWILVAAMTHWEMAAHGVTHRRAAVHWLAIGLGVLTKGPVVLIFGGAFWLATLWRRPGPSRERPDAGATCNPTQQQSDDRLEAGPTQNSADDRLEALPTLNLAGPAVWIGNWRWWAWASAALVVGLPWYVYIARHAGEVFVDQLLWFEIGSRILHAPHGHTGPPGFYVALSVAGLLPWTGCVPATIYLAVRRRRADASTRLLLWWLVVPWLFLELIRSKLPHYILPCYVPVAMLLARELVERFRGGQVWGALSRHDRVMFGLLCWPMILLGGLVMAAAVRGWGAAWSPGALAAGFVLAAGAGAALGLFHRSSIQKGCVALLAMAGGLQLATGVLLLPALEPGRLSRRVAEAIQAVAEPGDMVLLCGYKEPTTFVYLDRPAWTIDAGSLGELLASRKTGWPFVLGITERELDGLDARVRREIEPNLTDARVAGLNYVKLQRDVELEHELKLQREVVRLARFR